MFEECYSLTSLDLSHFDTSSVTYMEDMFYNCHNLEYINLRNFTDKKNQEFDQFFTNIAKNAVVCIDQNKSPTLYNMIYGKSCITVSCVCDWKSVQQKISNTGECINNSNSGNNKYEYGGKCYTSCPDNTVEYNYKCYPCGSNCKTCNFDKNILEVLDCTSCIKNKYLYNGKCQNTCKYGYYTESSINICKCEENIKCKKCSSESLSNNNLCISCNDNYYPKLNDNSNYGNFINCYIGNIDGYYLDINAKYYKFCYSHCKTCDRSGDDNNHNCLECNSEYKLQISKNGYYNCYTICDNYYYFNNEGKYICLNTSQCPTDFNKLILSKKQCIDDCSKDPDNQYEFRNACYNKCPSNISYTSNNYHCVVNCTKDTPLEIKQYQNCTDFCSINDMDNKLCISKYEDEDTNANLILNNIHKDIITTNFDKNNLYNNNKKIIINEVYTTFTITTQKIEKNNNLNKCESSLKAEYNLKNLDNLIILIINTKKDNNDVNNKIVYEVYADINNDNILTKLDLNICNDTSMNNEIIKCSNYSIESILVDLCISCIPHYYHIYNDTSNKNNFVKCYNSPRGYYLDSEDNIYKECYPRCDICDKKGTDINHNCLKCDSNYFYELHKNNYINCYKQCEFYFYYIEDIDKYYCTPDKLCPINISKLLIPQKNQCIDDCTKDSEYQYEFRHTCYKECPELISEISKTKNFYCEVICTKELPFEIIETQECTNNCTISQREKGFCKNNYQPKESEENKEAEKQVEQKAVENVKEELTQGFDTSNVDQGNNVVINQKGSTITISTTDNQKNDISSNTSTINLGDCEDKIKDEYNISKNKSLYILKVDVVQDGLQIPKIEYEVYYPLFGGSLIKLNLTSCKDSKIDLSIPVKLNDDIDKINSSSNYYNDICYTYIYYFRKWHRYFFI